MTTQEKDSGATKLTRAAERQRIERAAEDAEREAARVEWSRRDELARSAARELQQVQSALRARIVESVPELASSAWPMRLGRAEVALTDASASTPRALGHIDVIVHAAIGVTIPDMRDGYRGRTHSIWYCDPLAAGEYGWFETAFMHHPLMGRIGRHDPFALPPGKEAAGAVGSGMDVLQLAWPFTRLDGTGVADFTSRWIGWFADAANGELSRPRSMPERDTGSWRQR